MTAPHMCTRTCTHAAIHRVTLGRMHTTPDACTANRRAQSRGTINKHTKKKTDACTHANTCTNIHTARKTNNSSITTATTTVSQSHECSRVRSKHTPQCALGWPKRRSMRDSASVAHRSWKCIPHLKTRVRAADICTHKSHDGSHCVGDGLLALSARGHVCGPDGRASSRCVVCS